MCESRRPANGADSLPFDEMPDAAIDTLSADGAQESPPRYVDDALDPELRARWDIESAIWERE